MKHNLLFFLCTGILLTACSANTKDTTKTSEPENDPRTQHPIEVVVHRGANDLAPENTLPSADSALAHGATWIEVDVRVSKDGVMYNLHDETLDRTTNGKGIIGERTSVYIDKLDAGSWYDEKRFKGLHVPTIEAMLEGLKGRANVFFDVKDCNLQELADLVRRTGFADRSFFWFGSEKMLREFVQIAPEMKIKVNAADIERIEYWKTICTPSIVEIHADKITPDFLDYCHRNDIKVMVGAQGESLEDYRTAIETGADMINLDKPELFEKLQKGISLKFP
ncbi:MAG: glycerophosphodiester phosphodiesterase family protein [Bacteroidales bacterium]|nr:glycerophosphodiester phosphodiesterase family protein [Bacteroidales bacterium]